MNREEKQKYLKELTKVVLDSMKGMKPEDKSLEEFAYRFVQFNGLVELLKDCGVMTETKK